MTSGAEIQRRRMALSLTRAALAERIGVHVTTVGKWERGVYNAPQALEDSFRLWEGQPEAFGLHVGQTQQRDLVRGIGGRLTTLGVDGSRRCTMCGEIRPRESLKKSRRNIGGTTSTCLVCTRKVDRKRQGTPESRAAQTARRRRYYQEHAAEELARAKPLKRTIKYRARGTLRRAVRIGKIVKPTTCQECGSESILHGHHTDYTRPLDVEWLCWPCHARRHRRTAPEPSESRRPQPTAPESEP